MVSMKKRILVALLGATVALGLAGCSVASPDAGHQAVWVMKPWFFGHGGIDPTPVTTGRSYGALTSQAIDVNMLPQRVDMNFDDMMTKSGVPVSFHVVLAFKVTDPVKLVTQFGADVDDRGNWGFWNRNLDQPKETQPGYWHDARSWEECVRIGKLMAGVKGGSHASRK